MHMTAEAWVALAALVFTVLATAVTATTVILTRINMHKEELDQDISALRLSAYEEYKTLRKDINDVAALSRKEFGETILALRVKVTDMELWFRDRMTENNGRIEERLRQIELYTARMKGKSEGG